MSENKCCGNCEYFKEEGADGKGFVFEDGVEPDLWWWNKAFGFKTEWWELNDNM